MSFAASAAAPTPPPGTVTAPVVVQPAAATHSANPLADLPLPHLVAHPSLNPELMLAVFLLSTGALVGVALCFESYQAASGDPSRQNAWLMKTAAAAALYLLLVAAGFKLAYF